MNMQSLMKQVQKVQGEMMKEKQRIDSSIFETISGAVEVKMKGNKELISIKIDNNKIDVGDIEMLEDMILIAINDVIKKIDNETDSKMGKYTKGMPGLF